MPEYHLENLVVCLLLCVVLCSQWLVLESARQLEHTIEELNTVTTGRVLPRKLYRRHGALPDFHAFGMGNNVRPLQKLPRFPLLV
jgi:hypothetical protein